MDNQNKWSDLLKAAVTEPGLILKAYSNFPGYSLGNQLAAMMQCHLRDIEPGPINTYPGWQALNRQVKKGEKAIWLCMPLTRKITDEATGESAMVATNFVWKPRWFVVSQTEGEPVEPITTPEWCVLNTQEMPVCIHEEVWLIVKRAISGREAFTLPYKVA